MKTKTSTPSSFALPAAFLALAQGNELLDPALKKAIATDGEAIAILPLPEDFTGPQPEQTYDLAALRTEGAYVVAFNPQKLAALAAALGAEDLVIVEFPASPQDGPMLVRPGTGEGIGYLMPQPMPHDGPEGLLVEVGPAATVSEIQTAKRYKPAAESKPLPPPVVTASAERKTLEIAFGGVPAKEIREALKDPALGFRYSGRGTKRGVPANIWYGPDNPFTREKIAALLPVPVKAAA